MKYPKRTSKSHSVGFPKLASCFIMFAVMMFAFVPTAKAAPREVTTVAYTVMVQCDLKTAVKAGELDWVIDDFTPENIQAPSDCKLGRAQVVTFHFGRVISTRDAIAEMDEMGYRPATWPELLALAAAQPELQRTFPIIALGTQWRNPVFKDLNVPLLYEGVVGRGLYLQLPIDWPAFSRLLAVRK